MAKTFQNPEGKLDWQALGASLAAEFSGRLMYGVPLADYTSWKVGGPAALMAWPETAKDCSVLLEACRRDRIPYRILGCGTNLLVADTGVEALVINMTGQKGVFWQGARVRAEAGASLSNLAAQAGQRELSGLEFGIGIPGSVGGGVLMNAGAYGFQMSDVVRRVEVLTSRGEKKRIGSSGAWLLLPEKSFAGEGLAGAGRRAGAYSGRRPQNPIIDAGLFGEPPAKAAAGVA